LMRCRPMSGSSRSILGVEFFSSQAWFGRVSARRPRHFSLLRQRKVPKRKASLSPGRCAVPCAARFAGDARKLAALKQCAPLSPALLRCSARPHGMEESGRGIGCRLALSGTGDIRLFAVMRWRVAQGQADQGGRCLSEASSARPRLDRATQRTRSEAKGSASGSPFFCLLFFGEAKKSRAPAGARPGTPRKK
jgi:hypothetical protein